MLKEEYIKWILNKTNFAEEYTELFKILFDISYSYSQSKDRSLYYNGLETRYFFIDEIYGYDSDEGQYMYGLLNEDLEEPRVLEVLFRLARKISNDVLGDRSKGDRTGDWLYRMLHNLDLVKYSGELSQDDINDIFKKIGIWMYRTYDYAGNGGLFPLQNPPGNQRITETWYQMQSYINENFPNF